MTAKAEKFEFQTEARQLLDLMIHSIYSHKEIFLRELISNASDALDKLRFESVREAELNPLTNDLHVRIEADKEKRLLTIHDNGIGMTRDEVIRFIGTIAKSGTKDYLNMVRDAKNSGMPPELIGQFGVGFYSSFMAADRVTLVTRAAREDKAWRWESDGEGTYTLEETSRETNGTSVTLHLRPADTEDGLEDFTQEWTIRSTVKKYSDFVSYPIRMEVERTQYPTEEEKKAGKEPETIRETVVLNSMQAIWTRPESDVKDEEYNEFYKHISHDWNEPLARIPFKAEGRTEFRALIFLPSKAPFDLFMNDNNAHGIHLYIRRVFIMQDCKELIPSWLRFLRGVVDSEDLSLNISREILQQNRQIQIIHNSIIKKTLDYLATLQKTDKDKFKTFWTEFGRVVKEGIFQDQKNREKILDICMFQTTSSPEPVALEEIIGRMPEDQDTIYYLTGDSREKLENSPHLEAFRQKGVEVLLLTDPIDDIWVGAVTDYKGKKWKSAGQGEVDLGTEEEKKKAEEERKEKTAVYASLLEALGAKLADSVKEVRLSSRLTTSPACLVSDENSMSPQMEALLRNMGREVPKTKRILELNPAHPILEKLKARFEKDATDPAIADSAELLEGLAHLADGEALPNAAKFNTVLAGMLEKNL